MLIGAHLSNRRPLADARAVGAEVVQVFLSSPRSWKKPPPRPDAEELRSSPIPIYVHAPYLVNVMAGESRIRIPSRRILADTCEAAAHIGAAGVVVHGGHATGGGGLGAAAGRWRKALAQVRTEVPILIENTASGDLAAARRLEDVRRLWEEIGDLEVGFVLDTCHAWAGGEPLEGLVERVMAVTGRIDLVHANNSRDPFNSRRDRHANLKSGEIPPDLLAEVVRDARAPVVVETPSEGQEADIVWLRDQTAAG
ncbi:MAG: deoxyribonuclease IV [Acidimicrobiia bacterium]|nr:deoxyribonuclease IV [bacterium]MDE0675136.1 deoxyribonuclease IV [bacterium]MYB77963.1 deoxyribonuclease IV [Acidimicrobiia bacterium]MYD41070.1 deoxyribonuclease IV [Acidimicrobiia bacterium]